MYNRILVPLDGSDVAECVLPHVEAIALANPKAEITFMYAVQPLDTPLTDEKFKQRIETDAKSSASTYLTRVDHSQSYHARAQTRVIFGKPADSILDYAHKNNSDLIVIASHGLSGVGKWIRGSVADKVLHQADIPVLRIRAGSSKTPIFRKGKKMTVLVPMDGSAQAEKVLEHVYKTADHFGKENLDIVLIRVCELFLYPHMKYPPPAAVTWEEYLNYEKKRAKNICSTYLSAIKRRMVDDGLSVRTSIPIGSPIDTITKYLNKNKIDLIILSTHGRTGLSEFALGSVANKVMKNNPTPTMLVRIKH